MAFKTEESIFIALKQSIIGLDPSKAGELAKQVIKEAIDPVQAIERGYTQGLHTIGEKFSRGELFLPELMRAAKAMEEAMKILEPEIKKKKRGIKTLGRIVIGTVEGDLHDIGKNIVAVMLSVSGFEVHDLGRDVSIESFISKVQQVEAHILACSALLSTTMRAQARLIERLVSEGIGEHLKVMVGGAPVSKDWAESIGANGYAENAVEAVSLAKKFLHISEQGVSR